MVAAGKETGDLAHAMPYAPEFFQVRFLYVWEWYIGRTVSGTEACTTSFLQRTSRIHPSIHPPTHNAHTPQSEFRSAVADMKNSVASRENAQCSCAAQFIGAFVLFFSWLDR